MAYQFTRKVLVEGKTFEADAVIEASEIPAGCLESLLGVRWLIEVCNPPPVVLPVVQEVKPEPVAEAAPPPVKAGKKK